MSVFPLNSEMKFKISLHIPLLNSSAKARRMTFPRVNSSQQRQMWNHWSLLTYIRTFLFNHALLLDEGKGFWDLSSIIPKYSKIRRCLEVYILWKAWTSPTFMLPVWKAVRTATHRRSDSMCKWHVNENNYVHNRYVPQLPFQARGFHPGSFPVAREFSTLEDERVFPLALIKVTLSIPKSQLNLFYRFDWTEANAAQTRRAQFGDKLILKIVLSRLVKA